MKRVYCNSCGGKLEMRPVEGREREVCSVCAAVHYQNPLPVASIVIPNGRHEVLLVRRRKEPHKGMWCFPIGFAEKGESIEEAALRELQEEAGITADIVHLLDTSSQPSDFYGDLLIVTFEGKKTSGFERPGDDAEDARYFAISEMPPLAFPAQNKALDTYLRLHEEEWAIKSSMQAFVMSTEPGALNVPEDGGTAQGLPAKLETPQTTGDSRHEDASDGTPVPTLQSDELLGFLESDPDAVVSLWLEDVTRHSTTSHYRTQDVDYLRGLAAYVIRQFGEWMVNGQPTASLQAHYEALGRERRAQGFPLSQVLSSFSLLKKHIWMFNIRRGFWERPIDIYRVLELDKRVSVFFDAAACYTARGYEDRQR